MIRLAPGANAFALMFGVESMTRALLAAVIPLQAYDLLGEARNVSLVFLAASAGSLVAGFGIPGLIRAFGRGRVYEMGGALLVLAPALLATLTVSGQVSGMLARAFGTACLNVALALYVMEFVAKRDLVSAEPRRFIGAGIAWTVGPALGGILYAELGPWAAHLASGLCGLLILANYRWLRLEAHAHSAAWRPPPNPVLNIGRFARQRRLLLAWGVAYGRTAWWSSTMAYGPLYLVASGESRIAGALFVSASCAMLFTAPLWGRLAAVIGVRPAIVLCFSWVAFATFLAGLLAGWPFAAAACLIAGAVAAAGLDGIGNIPFLRLVRPAERPQMTAVFRSYIEVAELSNGALYALLLSFLPLPAVFAASAALSLASAALARYLPRGL
jgi:MFS family permease